MLTYTPPPGEYIGTAIENTVALVKRHGAAVSLTFNGTTVVAEPGCTAEAIGEAWALKYDAEQCPSGMRVRVKPVPDFMHIGEGLTDIATKASKYGAEAGCTQQAIARVLGLLRPVAACNADLQRQQAHHATEVAAAHAAGRREALLEVAEWCEAAAIEGEGHVAQWKAKGDRAMVMTWLNMTAGRRFCARHALALAREEAKA